MVNVIPHTEVAIRYTSTGGNIPLSPYFGCIAGEFKSVHKFFKREDDYDWVPDQNDLATKTQDFYVPESTETRLMTSIGSPVYYNSKLSSVTEHFPYPSLSTSYWTPDTASVMFAYDDIIWQHPSSAFSKAWLYTGTDYRYDKMIMVNSTGIQSTRVVNNDLGSYSAPTPVAQASYETGTAFIVYYNSTSGKKAVFAVPRATGNVQTGVNLLAGSTYKVFSEVVFDSGDRLPVNIAADGTISIDAFGGTNPIVIGASGNKYVFLTYVVPADVSAITVDFPSTAVSKYLFMKKSGETVIPSILNNLYADETETPRLNSWLSAQGNAIIAQVSTVTKTGSNYAIYKFSSPTPVITACGPYIKVDTSAVVAFDVEEALYTDSATNELINKIPASMLEGYVLYSDFSALAPTSMVLAKVHVEYNADFTSSAYLNRVFSSRDFDSLPFTFGNAHPENPLGFAKFITELYNGGREYYICIAESKTKAFTTMEKYRDILFIGNVWNEFGQDYNEYSWMTARKAKSDYRLVITWKKFNSVEYRVGTDATWEEDASMTSGNSVIDGTDYIASGIESGDIVEIDLGTSTYRDTVDSITDTQITTTNPITLEGYADYTWLEAVNVVHSAYAGDTYTGLRWLDSDDGIIKVWDGTAFVATGEALDANTAVLCLSNNIAYSMPSTVTAVVATMVRYRVYKQLTSSEVANAEVTNQSVSDPEMVKVYNKAIKWGSSYISNAWFVPAILGEKIAFPEHKPLSRIGLDSGTYTDVLGSYEFFTEDELDLLVGAGYFMYAKDPGTSVYCIREVTCGSKTNDPARRNLNAVTPVLTFAFSIYSTTKNYLARFNITEDTKELIKLAVQSVCQSYTGNVVQYLGTRLAKCSVTQIEEISDGIKITYSAVPQRSLNVIQNEIVVSNT